MSDLIQPHSFRSSSEAVRTSTGIVIPVFFPPGVDQQLGHQLLADTVDACVRQVERPDSVCLSIDGESYGRDVGEVLARRFRVRLTWCRRNKGKFQAVRRGMEVLWGAGGHDYLAALDADGDHFPHELANGVRSAQYARRREPDLEVLVLGRRISRHRPMGLMRGEMEELADRVLLDALAYSATVRGRPLRFEYATVLEEFPDFHSGFKMLTRDLARQVFLTEPNLCGGTEDAYFRHGCESVVTVESLLAGGCLVVFNRTTLNEPVISSFGLLERTRLVADKIVWPCRRLGIPGHFVRQWLRNHLPRLLLNTLTPQGREELKQIRRLVLEDLGLEDDPDEPIEAPLMV